MGEAKKELMLGFIRGERRGRDDVWCALAGLIGYSPSDSARPRCVAASSGELLDAD